MNAEDGEVGIPAGLLDRDPGARPSLHIMVASKAPWYELSDEVVRYDEFPDEW